MCNFKSLIVTKSGDVLCTHEDSHESIIAHSKDKYDLRDETADPEKLLFARVEIRPPAGNVFEKDLSKWTFNIDQNIIPAWFDDDNKKACFAKLEAYLADVIIDGQEIDLIENKRGLYIRNSKIISLKNSSVQEMWENSSVARMWENSSVQEMRENSSVARMWENSSVARMWGSSSIKVYSGSSKYALSDNAVAIEYYHDSPIIKVANNKIKIELMK